MIEQYGMQMHIHRISDIIVEEMVSTDTGIAWRKVIFMRGDSRVFEVAVFPEEYVNGVVWLTVKGEPNLRKDQVTVDELDDTLRDIFLLHRQAD